MTIKDIKKILKKNRPMLDEDSPILLKLGTHPADTPDYYDVRDGCLILNRKFAHDFYRDVIVHVGDKLVFATQGNDIDGNLHVYVSEVDLMNQYFEMGGAEAWQKLLEKSLLKGHSQSMTDAVTSGEHGQGPCQRNTASIMRPLREVN